MTTTQPDRPPVVLPDGPAPSAPPPAPARGAQPAPPTELAVLLGAGGLRLELSGRRLDVVLATPERRNAQTPATWLALAATARWAADVADVVVLRAEPPTFSAGLDRRAFTPEGIPGEVSLLALAGQDDVTIGDTIAGYQQGFSCWRDGPFVSVAAVQGAAVGAGFQLALACDLVVAADDARFAMRETSLGLVPDLAGTWPLVRTVGYARALEICATGRWVAADEAHTLGLAQHVVPLARLEHAVDELVAALLTAPADAVRATKALLRQAETGTPATQRAAERVAQVARLRALAARAGHQG